MADSLCPSRFLKRTGKLIGESCPSHTNRSTLENDVFFVVWCWDDASLKAVGWVMAARYFESQRGRHLINDLPLCAIPRRTILESLRIQCPGWVAFGGDM